MSRALTDKALIAAELKERAPGPLAYRSLTRTPSRPLDSADVDDGPANGSPHDHGSSWAIYGQATGVTE